MFYFVTSEFLGPDNVELDSNIVIFGQHNAKLGRIQCMLAAMLFLVIFETTYVFYLVTSQFLGPENVKFYIIFASFEQRNAKLGRIQCMLAAMLSLVTF